MKRIISFCLLVVLLSCNTENAPDCFQNSGDIVTNHVELATFTKITVYDGFELILKDGPIQSVAIETGEYLWSDIEVAVVNGTLELKNNNSCNYTREYGLTKAYVTAPNITDIRSSTALPIKSDGVLNYPSLKLISEDFLKPDANRVGIFNVELNVTNFQVVVNGLSTVYASGNAINTNISYVSGDARFEGRNLLSQNTSIFHRGTNDILVNTQTRLKANLVSTGNVREFGSPPDKTITEQFTGRVIFE